MLPAFKRRVAVLLPIAVTPQLSSDECCAYALSVESADDSDTVTLRCAVHGAETHVGFTDSEYATRIDDWFCTHAACTRSTPTRHAA